LNDFIEIQKSIINSKYNERESNFTGTFLSYKKIYLLKISNRDMPIRIAKHEEVEKELFSKQKSPNQILCYFFGLKYYGWKTLRKIKETTLHSLKDYLKKKGNSKSVIEALKEAIAWIQEPIFPKYQESWEVETILDRRLTPQNKVQFLIKWKNFGDHWNSWELEKNVSNDLIYEWLIKNPGKVENQNYKKKRKGTEISKKNKQQRVQNIGGVIKEDVSESEKEDILDECILNFEKKKNYQISIRPEITEETNKI